MHGRKGNCHLMIFTLFFSVCRVFTQGFTFCGKLTTLGSWLCQYLPPCRTAAQKRHWGMVCQGARVIFLFSSPAQDPSQMANEGEGCDRRARHQSTPINRKNPLDNVQVSTSNRSCSQFDTMVQKPRGRSCWCHSSPGWQPHSLWQPWPGGDKYQHLWPLGQWSRPVLGDIPTCVRSLPEPRMGQKENWLQMAAPRCCPG